MAYIGKDINIVLESANVMWTLFSDQLAFPIPYSNCHLVNSPLSKFWANSPTMQSDECSQVHTGQASATVSQRTIYKDSHGRCVSGPSF